jgi:hypothetical protein
MRRNILFRAVEGIDDLVLSEIQNLFKSKPHVAYHSFGPKDVFGTRKWWAFKTNLAITYLFMSMLDSCPGTI